MMRKALPILTLFLFSGASFVLAQKTKQEKSVIKIDMRKNIGTIRPLHGGNGDAQIIGTDTDLSKDEI